MSNIIIIKIMFLKIGNQVLNDSTDERIKIKSRIMMIKGLRNDDNRHY